jgi:hypothetical protein
MTQPIASLPYRAPYRVPYRAPRKFWAQHREASLNWIAFGLLLAAWNASDNDGAPGAAARRPESLRSHQYVSVRAITAHRAVMKAST